MRGWILAVASASVGAAAGVLIGLFVRFPEGGVPLGFASVALATAVSIPVAARSLQDRSRDRGELAERRRQRQERIGAHVRRLNQEVFLRLPDSTLESRSAASDPAGASRTGLFAGSGPESPAVEELPGWSCALAHLGADAELHGAWSQLMGRVGDRETAWRKVRSVLEDRLSTELLHEYGFEARLEGGRVRAPPWCDVPALSAVLLKSPSGAVLAETVELPPRSGSGTAASGPFSLLVGAIELMRGRTRDDVDPRRLARVAARVTGDSIVRQEFVRAARAEAVAKEALREFQVVARRFYDRVSAEGSI
ncbi:MAG TPA: hypothetical protein VEY07_06570, partial [Thermoplasmata archaeon]|nr:hypothetical protein [Thermoplasmata archaeon]